MFAVFNTQQRCFQRTISNHFEFVELKCDGPQTVYNPYFLFKSFLVNFDAVALRTFMETRLQVV